MSTIAFDNSIRQWARDLEDQERLRSGHPLPVARESLARRMGVPAGTLANIRRNRSKGLRSWVRDRIQSYVVREIEAEIARLTHELELVSKGPGAPEAAQIDQARAAIEAARKFIQGAQG